jgi:hypothetical protein
MEPNFGLITGVKVLICLAGSNQRKKHMKAWLIHCTYDYYCQGWEPTQEDFLVYADSYEEAVIKLSRNASLHNVREFINRTIC